MARSLASKPNVIAPGGSYPYGRIRDDDGTGNGTPVNELVYGDFHQFISRLMALGGVTANGLPENSADGFQIITALNAYVLSIIGGTLVNRTIAKIDAGLGSGILYQAGSVISASGDVSSEITITHNLGTTNYIVQLTPIDGNNDPIAVSAIGSNSFKIVNPAGAGRNACFLSIIK